MPFNDHMLFIVETLARINSNGQKIKNLGFSDAYILFKFAS